MCSAKILSSFRIPPRVLEPEAMADIDEVRAYDSLVAKYMGILHEGFVATLLNLGPEKGKVLEVGTGTGRIATTLAKYAPGYEVIAVDLSKNMLCVAMENAKMLGVENRVEFLLGDAKTLPFHDNTFDMVFSHNMMHHVPEPGFMLREMARVLKPDGSFVLRDLKRLSPFWRWAHVNLFGFNYDPVMKRQYEDSIRAALAQEEWKALLAEIPLNGLRLSHQFVTHLSISRPYAGVRGKKANLPISVKTLPRFLYVDCAR